MHTPSNESEQAMGRTPIHDQAMSAAERQRRRRARLRKEPWRDQRQATRAILTALREMQGDADGAISPELVAQIRNRAVASLGLDDEAALVAADEMVARLLDPAEPLPERGHRGRRERHHHRFGERMRAHYRRGGDAPDAD